MKKPRPTPPLEPCEVPGIFPYGKRQEESAATCSDKRGGEDAGCLRAVLRRGRIQALVSATVVPSNQRSWPPLLSQAAQDRSLAHGVGSFLIRSEGCDTVAVYGRCTQERLHGRLVVKKSRQFTGFQLKAQRTLLLGMMPAKPPEG